jgi:hypothetical protein
MEWKDVGKKILEILPVASSLATPFLGPAGPLIGLAAKSLSSYLGVKSENPQPDEIMAALVGSPDAAMKLEMARIDFEKEKMRLEYEERDKERDDRIEALGLQLADMQSARHREEEIIRVTGKDWDKRYLTIVGTLSPLLVLAYIVKYGLPNFSPELTLLIGNLIGILFAKLSTIFDYHMGTSSGSALKNQTITQMMAKK